MKNNVVHLFEKRPQPDGLSGDNDVTIAFHTLTSAPDLNTVEISEPAFPEHVLAISDAFGTAGDYESAFRILDGYELYGERYIHDLYQFIFTHLEHRQSTSDEEQIAVFDTLARVSGVHEQLALLT